MITTSFVVLIHYILDWIFIKNLNTQKILINYVNKCLIERWTEVSSAERRKPLPAFTL